MSFQINPDGGDKFLKPSGLKKLEPAMLKDRKEGILGMNKYKTNKGLITSVEWRELTKKTRTTRTDKALTRIKQYEALPNADLKGQYNLLMAMGDGCLLNRLKTVKPQLFHNPRQHCTCWTLRSPNRGGGERGEQ